MQIQMNVKSIRVESYFPYFFFFPGGLNDIKNISKIRNIHMFSFLFAFPYLS